MTKNIPCIHATDGGFYIQHHAAQSLGASDYAPCVQHSTQGREGLGEATLVDADLIGANSPQLEIDIALSLLRERNAA